MEDQAPEGLMRILVDLGAVTSSGIQAGTGTKHLQMTPWQMVRLTQTLNIQAIEALGLILHYGEIKLDPLRIHVPGYSYAWLMGHGMNNAAARKAFQTLKDRGIMTQAVAEEGHSAPRLGVVQGGAFGWEQIEVEPAPDGRRRRTSTQPATQNITVRSAALQPGGHTAQDPQASARHEVTSRRDDAASVQFGGGSQIVTPPPAGAVDNASGPQSSGSHDVTSRLDGGASSQVSRGSQEVTSLLPTPPSSSSQVVESLLSSGPRADDALTRVDLHSLLRDTRVRAAMGARQESTVVALAAVFASNESATRSALGYFDLPRQPGRSDGVTLAVFVVDLLAADDADLVDRALSLHALLRGKNTHLPKQRSDEFVTGLVAALGLAMDSTPKSWPGFVVHHSKQASWNSSKGLRGVISALTQAVRDQRAALASAVVFDERPASTEQSPSPTAPPKPHRRVEGQTRPELDIFTAPSESDPDYWDVLREAVRGSIWDDPYSFERLRHNATRRAEFMERYQQRRREA